MFSFLVFKFFFIFFFFFFSSRRRHTRCGRDWSSDVCSSDLSQTVEALPLILDWLHTRGDTVVPLSTLLGTTREEVMPPVQGNAQSLTRLVSSTGFRVYHRSEERRVGKECRSRVAAHH